MTQRRFGIPVLAVAAALCASAVVVVPAVGATGAAGTTRQVPAAGKTAVNPTPTGNDLGVQQPELGPAIGEASGNASSHNNNGVNRSRSIQHGAPDVTGAPVAAGVGVSSSGPLTVLSTFDGLNHRNQRLANGGNQFSVEPPDQGLCVGNGFILETVNDVMNVYDSSGTSLKGVTDLNSFYGYPPAIIRSPRFDGPFVTDPSCYFDKATQRWFHVVLTLDVKPLQPHAGALEGSNHLDIAVSQTASPLGTWTIYRIPVQDDGTMGTPNHHCTTSPYVITPDNPNACIGDYPHIGADANGFYITTNEYALFGPEFHGAQLYALSKRALARNDSSVGLTQISTQGLDNGNSGFTLWPAVAPADHYATANRGTEY